MKEPAINWRWLLAVATPLLFTALVLWISGTNRTVFLVFNAWGQWSPAVWSCITLLGDTLVLFCLLLLFAGRRPDVVWSVFIASLIVALEVHGLKDFFDHPRPPSVLGPEQLHTIGYIATSGSFPSGHTAAAFTLAGALSMLSFPRWLKVSALVLAVLVAISRMAVGIHWPADVLGGALVGWTSAAMGIWLSTLMQWGYRLQAQRILAVLLLFADGLLLFAGDLGYPLGQQMLLILPFAVLLLSLPGLRRLITGRTE